MFDCSTRAIFPSVSVPYFSGFMVIRWPTKEGVPRFQVSVPYFSGFMVIRLLQVREIPPLAVFQSPIFRGLWWYCHSPSPLPVHTSGFSPLFFGVYGDTVELAGLINNSTYVSVPYFSGFMVIRIYDNNRLSSAKSVSVPYFSGFMVILVRWW